MFHVELFAEAEPPEQGVEQLFHPGTPRNLIDGCAGGAQLLSNQDGIAERQGPPQRRMRISKQIMLAAVESQLIAPGKEAAGMIEQRLGQLPQALPGEGRNRQATSGTAQVRFCSHGYQRRMPGRFVRIAEPQHYIRAVDFGPRPVDSDRFDDILGLPEPRRVD